MFKFGFLNQKTDVETEATEIYYFRINEFLNVMPLPLTEKHFDFEQTTPSQGSYLNDHIVSGYDEAHALAKLFVNWDTNKKWSGKSFDDLDILDKYKQLENAKGWIPKYFERVNQLTILTPRAISKPVHFIGSINIHLDATVSVVENGVTQPLPHSIGGLRQSPGFSWGYEGMGCYALAHSILYYLYGNSVADKFAQLFVKQNVAEWPAYKERKQGIKWQISSIEIDGWLEKAEKTIENLEPI